MHTMIGTMVIIFGVLIPAVLPKMRTRAERISWLFIALFAIAVGIFIVGTDPSKVHSVEQNGHERIRDMVIEAGGEPGDFIVLPSGAASGSDFALICESGLSEHLPFKFATPYTGDGVRFDTAQQRLWKAKEVVIIKQADPDYAATAARFVRHMAVFQKDGDPGW